MFKQNEGIDIVVEIGGVTTVEEANRVFQETLDSEQLDRMGRIQHPGVRMKIANAIKMCQPDEVFINTGSEADRQFIREFSLNNGEEASLPMAGQSEVNRCALVTDLAENGRARARRQDLPTEPSSTARCGSTRLP